MTPWQRFTSSVRIAPALALLMVGQACATEDTENDDAAMNPIAQLLTDGRPVFGIFSGEHTAAQGAAMAATRETDFVFYSLENGPFDISTMQGYMQAMEESSGEEDPRPIALRIPPIMDEQAQAQERVEQALAAGVAAVVFPHVQTAGHAAVSVSTIGESLWPRNPTGAHVNMLIVEDQEGIANVRDIVSTPGISIVFAGPGDLRRAYEGDMEAVETAIQGVLAACKEFDVPCGITAGVDDIARRLEEGFRVIIVTDPEALTVGRQASGRTSD